MKRLVNCVIAGLLICLIWGIIAYLTGIKAGVFAWAVSASVGICFASGSEGNKSKVFLAIVIASSAILLGKFIETTAENMEFTRKTTADTSENIEHDELMVAYIAHILADDLERQGKKVQWPAVVNNQRWWDKGNFPVGIWEEAKGYWDSIDAKEKQSLRETAKEKIMEDVGEFAFYPEKAGFIFGVSDVLMFVLAGFTTYIISGKNTKSFQKIAA
ncbi:hypothetical protein STSP2_00466 [Anaerohalosphaera lusitana]|uniref:Uncharacterized protein n=1 Tax=Anaerohalosphaera lusitana TaxID=1936003 RepID=A0A1U9NHB8_9BACT|nr:hypothetical protein [Anaerohalosphaera lusitana]AQT67323.1 hypothetical protein STSP2_00466 [Anaerohalosphaera lusitana]